MVMNLDGFKQLSDVVTTEIEIKNLKDKVKIKKLDAQKRTELEYLFMNGIKSAEELFNVKLRAIIASVVDDNNKQVFEEKDRKIIMQMDSEVLTKIWQKIQEFNFSDGEQEIENQAKN